MTQSKSITAACTWENQLTSDQRQQVLALVFLSAVVLWGHIEAVVLYSTDGIVYSLVAKELSQKPLVDWVVLTWNGASFFEHPHLTPWILGGSFKLFGTNTLSAVAPIVLISNLTVVLTYLLGRRLLDHRLGILSASVLVLTPQFIRGARNPMLEPALMLCIMLSVFFHIRSVQEHKRSDAFLVGVFFGLAFLAKGPPAILAVAVIAAFQCLARISTASSLRRFALSWPKFMFRVSGVVIIGCTIVAAVDLWHYLVRSDSFIAHYFSDQLSTTIVDGRGVAKNDLWFYLRIFAQYWPWLPFVLAAIPLVVWKRDRSALAAVSIGSLVSFGTLLGFTLLRHKYPWYIDIHYCGSSILAAVSLRYLVSENAIAKYYIRSCFGLGVTLLLLSSSFPSLFTYYPRPFERFVEAAQRVLSQKLEGQRLADCIGLDPWKGKFFVKFYLGAIEADCADPSAGFKIVDNRTYLFRDRGERILFAQHPFSIVERSGVAEREGFEPSIPVKE